MSAQGEQNVRITNRTVAAAAALSGKPSITFRLTQGGKLAPGVTGEVALSLENAEVLTGRLERLRELERREADRGQPISEVAEGGRRECTCTWDEIEGAEGIVAYDARCPVHAAERAAG